MEGKGIIVGVAEHTNENLSPAMPDPEWEILTGPNSTITFKKY